MASIKKIKLYGLQIIEVIVTITNTVPVSTRCVKLVILNE